MVPGLVGHFLSLLQILSFTATVVLYPFTAAAAVLVVAAAAAVVVGDVIVVAVAVVVFVALVESSWTRVSLSVSATDSVFTATVILFPFTVAAAAVVLGGGGGEWGVQSVRRVEVIEVAVVVSSKNLS